MIRINSEMRFTVDNSMIFFDRVTKIYGNGQKALDNVSLKVGRGNLCFWRRQRCGKDHYAGADLKRRSHPGIRTGQWDWD